MHDFSCQIFEPSVYNICQSEVYGDPEQRLRIHSFETFLWPEHKNILLCALLILLYCLVGRKPSDPNLHSVQFSFSPTNVLFRQPLILHGHLLYLQHYTQIIGDLLVERKNISYGNCMLQVFSKHLFGMTEVLILTVMAFDRYVAIRKPLHYVIITNRTRYNLLVLAAWACGAVHSFPQFSVIIQLPFCGANKIDRYFCDIFPLLKVACTDTYITGVIMLVNSRMVTLRTFVILFFSYVTILFTLRNHSAEGKRKALSTCGSHVTVI